MRTRHALMSIMLTVSAGTAGAADGLVAPDGRDVWPQWQARITVSTSRLAPVSLTDAAALRNKPPQLGGVLGDYYFNMPWLQVPATVGGLRATGGLLSSTRGLGLGPAAASPDPTSESAVAYLGLGYTGLAAKGGWGVTADLGLAAEGSGGALRLGRALFGNQGFDSTTRELRLSPVLQLGLHYAF